MTKFDKDDIELRYQKMMGEKPSPFESLVAQIGFDIAKSHFAENFGCRQDAVSGCLAASAVLRRDTQMEDAYSVTG